MHVHLYLDRGIVLWRGVDDESTPETEKFKKNNNKKATRKQQ